MSLNRQDCQVFNDSNLWSGVQFLKEFFDPCAEDGEVVVKPTRTERNDCNAEDQEMVMYQHQINEFLCQKQAEQQQDRDKIR